MEQRLIDANKLKQHYAWWGECSESTKENKRLFDEIIDLQPTVGGWVSVKEAYPEYLKWVIVTNGVEFEMAYRVKGIGISDGWAGCKNSETITYWQPLPAPPEVE